jgi:phage terminase large subunit
MNTLFLEGTPPERSFIRCVLSEDNPWFYKTTMPAERRSAWIKYSNAKFRHVWRGALNLNPDLAVYSNWTIGRLELIGSPQPRYGLDWGFSDPLAIVEFFVIEAADPDTERGKIYVMNEIYGSWIPARTIPQRIDEKMPMARLHTITADSSEPKSIDDLASAGFHVIGARKGPGSIRAGISIISGYDIVVSPDCPNFASELSAYQWKTTKSGVITRDPVDSDNHLLDALRYGFEDYQPEATSVANGGVEWI